MPDAEGNNFDFNSFPQARLFFSQETKIRSSDMTPNRVMLVYGQREKKNDATNI